MRETLVDGDMSAFLRRQAESGVGVDIGETRVGYRKLESANLSASDCILEHKIALLRAKKLTDDGARLRLWFRGAALGGLLL